MGKATPARYGYALPNGAYLVDRHAQGHPVGTFWLLLVVGADDKPVQDLLSIRQCVLVLELLRPVPILQRNSVPPAQNHLVQGQSRPVWKVSKADGSSILFYGRFQSLPV